MGSINLTIEAAEQQQRLKQHALYNYTNKYANLKTEMGSAYVRHLLARQATAVKAQHEMEQVVIALVGDLAAYRPNAKVVIFEGGGDTAFDVRMTCTLFPEFEQRINPIAAGNKKRG